MQNDRITTAVKNIADYMGCETEELSGYTLGELFSQCEHSGAQVYWMFWSEAELNTVYIEIPTEEAILPLSAGEAMALRSSHTQLVCGEVNHV